MEGFLYSASIYLGAAVIAVPVAARLGLGSVLGYLAAGILIGPLLGLVGAETKDLQHFAEFGVVMMLFLIGLELEPRALWDMRHRLIGLGGLQIVLTTVAIMGGAMAFGFYWSVALAVGLIFALSSTAIVLQTLSEKGLMRTAGGRSTFSVLLTQDIAVIPMLALLPLLALPKALSLNPDGSIERHANDAHASDHINLSLVADLPGWGVTLVTLAVIGAIILAGVYLARPVFRFIHASHLREMFTALALLIVVGISFLMLLVGLSPALGAFLAGVVLANSEFRHELETDIEPFKGLLLGLFFITVGAGINFAVLERDPAAILGATLAVILVKGLVLYALSHIFKLYGSDRWLFTLGLAQAGEFGFILTAFSVAQNVIPIGLSERILLIIALSMLITPLLFILMEVIGKRIGNDLQDIQHDVVNEEGLVIIAGVGRFGQIVNRLVGSAGFKTVVLDHDLKTIELMRRFGFKGFYGDPTRPDVLRAAGLADARVLVIALDDRDAALKMVRYARKERPDLHIIARAGDRSDVFRLYQAGANDIVREMFDSSLRAGRYVLENIGLSEFEAAEAEKTFYAHDRHAIRELAQVWDPDIASGENEAYVARAKELERDLEASLLTLLETRRSET
ncbi:CPA2 family monovalent cation:H+ antiporter-2 [Planktotalea frisia]|jgi:CPA2 family monovalent cation:H+ antiporter-2|uniref:Glutathione-regulated potassium-efflux system protein KefC n=1 Tax=Planktotalea frisia TaxID=696762 RepID=A0A1L9NW57_9RHOB|nr:monovalent cation:proton antiporter-2 (CPA2) family protein [Planktotalea frisia]OJI93517.1 glutathione-regulated potassium-efflux system protein KefC [Planktotalea frisia]PZX27734.1 CPA2 family monovalent cation:H+ antiporter-2 [Planktotalea frisia]